MSSVYVYCYDGFMTSIDLSMYKAVSCGRKQLRCSDGTWCFPPPLIYLVILVHKDASKQNAVFEFADMGRRDRFGNAISVALANYMLGRQTGGAPSVQAVARDVVPSVPKSSRVVPVAVAVEEEEVAKV